MSKYREKFMASLRRLKEKEVKTDVILRLPDNSTVPCHKLVLMAASPYFETMFTTSFKDSSQEEVSVKFPGANADAIRMIIQYFYSGEIDLNVENAEDIMTASGFLGLDDSKAECDELMANHIDSSNCIRVFAFGQKFDLPKLTSNAHEFIVKHFHEALRASPDFKLLKEADLVEILQDDDLNVATEDIVFEAVVRWVNADLNERKEAFTRVASKVRFPFCTKETLNSITSKEPLMSNPQCLEFVSEAQQFRSNNHHYVHNERTIPRKATKEIKPHLFRVHDTKVSGKWQIECCEGKRSDGQVVEWKKISIEENSLHNPLVSPCGFISLSGGENFFIEVLNGKLHCFSLKQPNHQEIGPVFQNQRIFVFGGKDEKDEYSDCVQSMGSTSAAWESETPMPLGLQKPYAIKFMDKIYVFGGKSAEGLSRATMEYNPLWHEWKMCSEMPGVCKEGATVALNDKIYLVGGEERVCFSFAPAADTWTVLAPPQNVYNYSAGTTWNGKILLVGRKNAEGYDPEKDAWSSNQSLVPTDCHPQSEICFGTFLY